MSESADSNVRTICVSRDTLPLYDRELTESLSSLLMKTQSSQGEDSASNQETVQGRKIHPFDMKAVTDFQTSNVHHSACIKSKTTACVGLGFKDQDQGQAPSDETGQAALKAMGQSTRITDSTADKTLDPITEISFADVLNDIGEDYWQIANAGIEVVRSGKSKSTTSTGLNGNSQSSSTKKDQITGLYHVPGWKIHKVIEDDQYNHHFEIMGEPGTVETRFAAFGDKERFVQANDFDNTTKKKPDHSQVSELITFRQPSSLSRFYGFPDWLSAVTSIELVQMIHQHNHDFFMNRGVPEFMLFITGGRVGDDEWERIENAIKANIGIGNSYKSTAVNLTDSNLTIQVEKLGLDDQTENSFGDQKDNLAMDVVSAHRTPPLLAGIQIPGKLGATNELPNALMAFQILTIAPGQRIISQRLGNTLGNKNLNGGLPLGPEHFQFNTITDYIDIGQMDTVSRMRQSPAQAAAEGRDLNEGPRQ